MQQDRPQFNWMLKSLTTIFSAASQILSKRASDTPFIPVKLCTTNATSIDKATQALNSNYEIWRHYFHLLCLHHQSIAGIDPGILKLLDITSIYSMSCHCQNNCNNLCSWTGKTAVVPINIPLWWISAIHSETIIFSL
mgnify:CR=1 FL=1